VAALGEETGDGQSYLPDFCSARAVLVVVLIAEMVALVLTLAGTRDGDSFLLGLSTNSLFVLWIALTSAAVLCRARRWLGGIDVVAALTLCFALLQVVTLVISEAAWWLDRVYAGAFLQTQGHGWFLLRNLGISSLVSAVALRYFYVAGEWRRNVELEARARIRALQARIRPHFLFNSMNTIAALIGSDPGRAEEAVEDLSDLFRATLAEAQSMIPLKQELEVARIYQRMEQLRLGERLTVEWDVAGLPMRSRIPGLMVQPLLENAIYHGIEPLPEGGTVSVAGRRDEGDVILTISNPRAPGARRRDGNRLALDNIRQRLKLAFGSRAGVDVEESEQHYRVTLRFPAEVPEP
jgi:two-component system sensor histidine kinase AlgZ